jgi:hypothetical protein
LPRNDVLHADPPIESERIQSALRCLRSITQAPTGPIVNGGGSRTAMSAATCE